MAAHTLVIIGPPAIKVAAAQHLVVTTHAAAPCKPVLEVIGNQATAALEALTLVPHTDGNLSGVIQDLVCIRLASVAVANIANQDVRVQLQFACVC